MADDRTCRTCGAEGCFGLASRGASCTGWCPPKAAERLDAETEARKKAERERDRLERAIRIVIAGEDPDGEGMVLGGDAIIFYLREVLDEAG